MTSSNDYPFDNANDKDIYYQAVRDIYEQYADEQYSLYDLYAERQREFEHMSMQGAEDEQLT